MKALLQLFGWLNVGLGTAGVFVPLLPTTPFLLVAAWAFARRSDRFHAWLVNHRDWGRRSMPGSGIGQSPEVSS